MKLNEHYDRIIEILLERKKGRCWKGYKPTPGVKPYAKGSCQPVSEAKSPAWQRKEGKSESGDLKKDCERSKFKNQQSSQEVELLI
jgi:hypothetical protein